MNISNNAKPPKYLWCYFRLYNQRQESQKITPLPDSIFYIDCFDLYCPNLEHYRYLFKDDFDFKLDINNNQIIIPRRLDDFINPFVNKCIISLVSGDIEPQNQNVYNSFIAEYKEAKYIPTIIEKPIEAEEPEEEPTFNERINDLNTIIKDNQYKIKLLKKLSTIEVQADKKKKIKEKIKTVSNTIIKQELIKEKILLKQTLINTTSLI